MSQPATKCSLCGGDAFFRQPYSGQAYCRSCFPRAFENRVRDHIARARLLRPRDRIAVAVSGGKDSVSLLHLLTNIERAFPKAELLAVSIDEGIRGYRHEALDIAAENTGNLGVEHHVLTFRDLYGRDLDQIAEAATAKGESSICAFCGILRRKALNVAAKRHGATVLATAHNLDDEAQSFLMSLLRGDISPVGRSQGQVEGFIRRAKPFSTIPEREVALYAYLKEIRPQSVPCPYAGSSIRNDVRRFLDVIEAKHPGMKFSVRGAIDKLGPFALRRDGTSRTCAICGEPSSGELCRSCQVLQRLGILA
jgi:uncharacterized protein (TIGR00269 family)